MSDCHVLLIEGHALRRDLVASALTTPGLSLHACGSVAQARNWIDRHGVPDLLLADLALPGESALDFIGAMRAGAEWQQVLPVVAMLATHDAEQQAALVRLDVRPLAHQTLAPADLRDAVSAALEAQSAIPERLAVTTRFGGDAAMYQAFHAAALQQLPADTRRASEALAMGDGGTLQRTAHDLKGVLALLREDGASEVARRLEHVAGGDLQRAGAIWDVLRAWLHWYAPADGARAAWGRAPSLYLPLP